MSRFAHTVSTVLACVLLVAPSAFAQEDSEVEFGPESDNNDSAENKDDDAEAWADELPKETPKPAPVPAPAAVAVEKKVEPVEKTPVRFRISGYIQPQFDVRYRPNAFPRDRTEYGAQATRTGVVMEGSPLPGWSYNFHLVVSAGLLNVVTGVEVIDRDGDGQPDAIGTNETTNPGIFIERATVAYQPAAMFKFEAGQMRIPFTLQAQSANSALMFPRRSGPNQVFVSGTDLGGLLTFAHNIGSLSAGIYNGTGADSNTASERGLLYATRIDVNPLGPFPFGESQNRGGPLRVGVGAGMLYFPSSRFDDSGFEGVRARDLRASLSFRLAAGGLYFSAEGLRRQQTDSLSSRPLVATGAYAQASYYVAIKPGSVGVAPIARLGVTIEDQSFDPRTTLFTEAGLSFFLHRGSLNSDAIKLIVQYLGEQRITEGEDAYGGVAQLQLAW